jgi:exodeoxyribonuclease-1
MAAEDELWAYAQTFFDKKKDQQRISSLDDTAQVGSRSYQSGILVSVQGGSDRNYQVPALHIGQSNTYKNQSLWLRLDQEPETFHQLADLPEPNDDDLTEATWVIRKKYGEPPLVLPPLDRYWKKLTADSQTRAQENLNWLIDHPQLLQKITDYYRAFTWPEIPNMDPYAALYQGFIKNKDASLAVKFHLSSDDEKQQLVQQFQDPRFRALANRILKLQDDEASTDFDFGVDAIGNPRRDKEQIQEAIAKLQQENDHDGAHRQLLKELQNYMD